MAVCERFIKPCSDYVFTIDDEQQPLGFAATPARYWKLSTLRNSKLSQEALQWTTKQFNSEGSMFSAIAELATSR